MKSVASGKDGEEEKLQCAMWSTTKMFVSVL